MAREFPIHNGRMTTDLDANGHKIKNLPPGSGFTQAQSDWGQTDTTAPDFIKNKPEIPASVTIVPALSPTSENPVQNKVVAKALYTGFTEWEFSGQDAQSGHEYTVVFRNGSTYLFDGSYEISEIADSLTDETIIDFNLGMPAVRITATRHLITPTKTSQLTNDGAPNGGGTPYATTAQIPDVTGKADKAVPSAAGNLAALNAQGNLADSGAKVSDFATPSDLPYALVTPGEWEFSELPSGYSDPVCEWNSSENVMLLTMQYEGDDFEIGNYDVTQDSLSVSFRWDEGPGTEAHVVTATRASLPGHLLDRAGNLVVVTGDTTLTIPAAVPGYIRDFLVRLEISGSTVPTITFQGQGSEAPNGADEITYETDGDEFPVPDEAGTLLYSFTETASHTFAVSLKKVNTVTQGGS